MLRNAVSSLQLLYSGLQHSGLALAATHGSALSAVQHVRCISSLRDKISQLLKTPEITSLLQEGGVDFRDCFERQQLVERLGQSLGQMPQSVQSRLQELVQARSAAGAGPAALSLQPPTTLSSSVAADLLQPPHQGMPPGLFVDEQYIVSLFQRCKPSVVHIAAMGLGRPGMAGGPSLDPDRVPQGFGSGFLWDKEGHVVTNYHVIHNAHTAQVTLSNNKKFTASLRGAEPDKDLAVLKIDAAPEDLVPVEVGVSSRLVVGQKVFAIGNPFGLDHTLTAGIVSGLGREMQSMTGHRIRDVVQTDASINPGNSGGPLLDSRGRLIGVNTAATSHPVTTAGFGFAIPSDTVRRIVNQLIKYGRVVRPGLGVLCMHDVHSRQLLGGDKGVVVESVVPRSGADQAGLRGIRTDHFGNVYLGDVITAVARQPVTTVEDLVAYVEQFAVGDQVPITVHRYEGRSQLDRTFSVAQINVPLTHEVKSKL